jgi:flagellar protein FliS
MYSSGQSGASAYARVNVETGVIGASPHRLIVMLYQGARRAISISRMHLKSGNVPGKGKAIGHAVQIISAGLYQGLNMEAGGELAERLGSVYDYMVRRLIQANAANDESMLIEVDTLLASLEEAWTAIGPEVEHNLTVATEHA